MCNEQRDICLGYYVVGQALPEHPRYGASTISTHYYDGIVLVFINIHGQYIAGVAL